MTLEEIILNKGSGAIVLLGKIRPYAVSDGAYIVNIYSKTKARLWRVSFQEGKWKSYGDPLFKDLNLEAFAIN